MLKLLLFLIVGFMIFIPSTVFGEVIDVPIMYKLNSIEVFDGSSSTTILRENIEEWFQTNYDPAFSYSYDYEFIWINNYNTDSSAHERLAIYEEYYKQHALFGDVIFALPTPDFILGDGETYSAPSLHVEPEYALHMFGTPSPYHRYSIDNVYEDFQKNHDYSCENDQLNYYISISNNVKSELYLKKICELTLLQHNKLTAFDWEFNQYNQIFYNPSVIITTEDDDSTTIKTNIDYDFVEYGDIFEVETKTEDNGLYIVSIFYQDRKIDEIETSLQNSRFIVNSSFVEDYSDVSFNFKSIGVNLDRSDMLFAYANHHVDYSVKIYSKTHYSCSYENTTKTCHTTVITNETRTPVSVPVVNQEVSIFPNEIILLIIGIIGATSAYGVYFLSKRQKSVQKSF